MSFLGLPQIIPPEVAPIDLLMVSSQVFSFAFFHLNERSTMFSGYKARALSMTLSKQTPTHSSKSYRMSLPLQHLQEALTLFFSLVTMLYMCLYCSAYSIVLHFLLLQVCLFQPQAQCFAHNRQSLNTVLSCKPFSDIHLELNFSVLSFQLLFGKSRNH